MKKSILLATALLAFSAIAHAEPLRLVCTNTTGVTALNIRSEFCRISLKQDGTVATLFCGVNRRWDSENQIFVSRQNNGLTSLSQVENIQTSNLAMPVLESSIDTNDVVCRLAK